MRNSPDKPTSPIKTVSARTGWSLYEEAIAVATAKSAAGSLIRSPLTTLVITSWFPRFTPSRRVSTAAMISRRLKSIPFAVRRGLPKLVGVVSPWTSTNSGRVPSIVTAIAEPGALIIRSAKKTSLGLRTSTMPRSCISKTPTSLVAP